MSPVGLTADSRNRVDSGVVVNLKVCPAHCPFTVYSRHCPHFVQRMFETHQSSFTMEHASYIHTLGKTTRTSLNKHFCTSMFVPVGKGANDLAHPALITSKSSEITTDPSAAIPQYSLTPPSEPYINYQVVLVNPEQFCRDLISKEKNVLALRKQCQIYCRKRQRQSFLRDP